MNAPRMLICERCGHTAPSPEVAEWSYHGHAKPPLVLCRDYDACDRREEARKDAPCDLCGWGSELHDGYGCCLADEMAP